jgi:hypothetical protein
MMLSMAINIEADAASIGIKQFIISAQYRSNPVLDWVLLLQ